MAQYVGQASVGKGPREFARALWENRSTLFSLDTAWDSARLLLYREEAKSSQSKYRKQILDDGVLKPRKWSEKEWKRRWPNSVERYSNLHKNVYKGLDPTAQEYFEKTLAFMNEQGQTPVIVLTPVNPKLRKILEPLGWTERHEEVVAYVESMQDEYDFVFLDMTDPTGLRLRQEGVVRRRAPDHGQHAAGHRLHPRADGRLAAVAAAGGRAVGPAACSSTATRSS